MGNHTAREKSCLAGFMSRHGGTPSSDFPAVNFVVTKGVLKKHMIKQRDVAKKAGAQIMTERAFRAWVSNGCVELNGGQLPTYSSSDDSSSDDDSDSDSSVSSDET